MIDHCDDEGVGDAHSSEDTQDNITREERRGITEESISDKNSNTKLMKESNQEKVQQAIENLSQKKRKEMTSEERLRLLQLKLYQKAKQEQDYRFYVLYDKIFLPYVLVMAYKGVKSKGSSAGIDGQTFKDIEDYGRAKFLKELGEELRKRTYKPQAVKRKWIDKESGGQRPLGIPTIRDRIAQTACKLIIEPIYEADFDESSHGFRPKRDAKGAMAEIKKELQVGKTEVYDADLSKYFDTIPHDKLMIALKERISDPRVLHLIKLWLKVPIVEEDGRFTGGKKSHKGTPQGGVISPLLANIYLNLLDRIVNNPLGKYAVQGIKMIRYADDFIIMARQIKAESLGKVHELIKRMDLQINETKSELIKAKEKPFDFLGFTVRYDRSIFGKGKWFWNISPSQKSRKKIRQKINAKLKKIGHYPPQKVANELNPIIRGWQNYYRIEKISATQIPFKELEDYLRDRLFRYYNRKSQRRTRLHGQQAFDMLVEKYGLIKPYKSSGLRPVNTL